MLASLANEIPVASPWGDALPETTDRDTFDGTMTAQLRGGDDMRADGPVDTSVAAVDPDALLPMQRGAGTHGVQLGAYTDGSRVYEGWRELQGRAPALLGNLLRVNEGKLNALSSSAIKAMMSVGALGRIYAHLKSLDNFAAILERANAASD